MSTTVAGARRRQHGGHTANETRARNAIHAHAAAAPGEHAVSPLWWSASQRLACAAVLIAVLWLVIAWAIL